LVYADLQPREVAFGASHPRSDEPIRSGFPRGSTIRDVHLTELAVDDSDKEFAVPSGATWQVLYLRYEYTADATVGTRTPTIQFRDNTDDIIYDIAGPTIVASGTSTQEAGADVDLDLYLPPIVLHGGYDVRVVDIAAIAPTADDLVVHLIVREQTRRG
jgi:hypothetical protein